ETLQLILTLNEAVTVNTAGGDPSLVLNDGATATYEAASSDPSAGKLAFAYTVGPHDATPNLSVFLVDLPHGTTVQDSSGYNANSSTALNQPTGLQVGPAFVNGVRAAPSLVAHTGQTVALTFTMSQAVTVDASVDTPTLTLNDGAIAAYDAAAS